MRKIWSNLYSLTPRICYYEKTAMLLWIYFIDYVSSAFININSKVILIYILLRILYTTLCKVIKYPFAAGFYT